MTCPRCWPASPKSRRSRSASARPVKPEEPSTEEVKPITLKRRLLQHHGLHEDAAGAVVVERFFHKARRGEPVEARVVVSDAGAVVGDEPPPLTLMDRSNNSPVRWIEAQSRPPSPTVIKTQ